MFHILNFAGLILCTEKQLSPNCFRKKKPEFICLVTPSAQLLAQLTKAGLPYCLHLLDFLTNTLLPDSPRNKKRLTGKMVTNFHPLDHTVHYQTTPIVKDNGTGRTSRAFTGVENMCPSPLFLHKPPRSGIILHAGIKLSTISSLPLRT